MIRTQETDINKVDTKLNLKNKGRRIWNNIPKEKSDEKLPGKGMSYREYDLYPKPKKGKRDSRRILIGDDGSEWYTSDHFHSFARLNK